MQTSKHQKIFVFGLLMLIASVVIIMVNLIGAFGLTNGNASGLVAIGIFLSVGYVLWIVFKR